MPCGAELQESLTIADAAHREVVFSRAYWDPT